MKNRLIIFFLILLCSINFNEPIFAEEFIFESKSLEFKDGSNIVYANDGVKITTKNKIKITAKQSIYNKITSKLTIKGNVVFYDIEKDIKILSEEIIYEKNIEKITSIGKTLAYLPNDFFIDTKNLEK